MNTKTTPLASTPIAGKLIYVSSTPFVPGADPDAHCESDKPPGTGTVEALLARTTAAASTHLDAGTVYVRPDGQIVGTGQQLIDTGAGAGALLDTGIWQAGNGTYGSLLTWVGAGDLTTTPLATATCTDWTVTTGSGRVGLNNTTTSRFFSNGSGFCNNGVTHLYCVEQ